MNLVLLISSSFASDKCIEEAGLYARLFSAKENEISVKDIQLKSIQFYSEENKVLFYAVILDNREQLNVGLIEKDCTLKLINKVTND